MLTFFIYGPDTFRSLKKVEEIREKFRRDVDPRGNNILVLSEDDDLSVEKIKAVNSQGGFLVSKKLIIVKNLLRKAKPTAKEQEELVKYLDKSTVNNILVFWEDESEGDYKKKATKTAKPLRDWLLKRGKQFVYDFSELSVMQLNNWIKKEIEARGGRASGPAIQQLISVVGNDLWQIDQEINKLVAHNGEKEIGIADVNELTIANIDNNIFNLIDAVGNKNQKLALKLINDQLHEGLEPMMLLSLISKHVRLLTVIKDSNAPTSDALAKELGLHPFVVKKAFVQARSYSLLQLKKLYANIFDIEKKLKSSAGDPSLLFDLLVVNNR